MELNFLKHSILPTNQIFTHNFRHVRKIAKSYYYLRLSIRLSVRMEQLGRNWTDFYESCI